MNQTEKKHIERNQHAYTVALAAATRSVREDAHFVGLDKIRVPIAKRAALKAIGFEFHDEDSWRLPASAGQDFKKTQDLVEAAYRAALNAARAALEGLQAQQAEQQDVLA